MELSLIDPNYPTYRQILRKVRRMPTLEREEYVAAHCINLPVRWRTRFFGLNDDAGPGGITGRYHLTFLARGWVTATRGLIYVSVEPGAFPELERLHRATRVDLSGTIREVDKLLGITLDLRAFAVMPRTPLDRLIGLFERS